MSKVEVVEDIADNKQPIIICIRPSGRATTFFVCMTPSSALNLAKSIIRTARNYVKGGI